MRDCSSFESEDIRLNSLFALMRRVWFSTNEPLTPFAVIGANQLPCFLLLVNGITMAEFLVVFFRMYTGLENELPLPLISSPMFSPIEHHLISPVLKPGVFLRKCRDTFSLIQ